MKKASVFFLVILILTVGVFVVDWLKATYFVYKFHSVFVILKTIYWPVTGILLMWFSVSRKVFTIFLITYLAMWGGYFGLKILYMIANQLHLFTFSGATLRKTQLNYMDFVKLLTPIPFIFFWVVDRIFYREQKKQS